MDSTSASRQKLHNYFHHEVYNNGEFAILVFLVKSIDYQKTKLKLEQAITSFNRLYML